MRARRRCALAGVMLALLPPVPAAAGEEAAQDPCAGLLAVLDRPTVADSPCVVGPGGVVVETGAVLQAGNGGTTTTLLTVPQAQVRVGLPHRFELRLFPPSYNRQTTGGHTTDGTDDPAVGVKHELARVDRWIFTADARVSVPSGTDGFGLAGPGATLNMIAGYSVTDRIGLSAMLGISTLTDPAGDDTGRRYTSVNPDLVGTYQFSDSFQAYVELFGKTRAGPALGGIYSVNGGLQYLVRPWFEIDVEAGGDFIGPPGTTGHFVGAGIGLAL